MNKCRIKMKPSTDGDWLLDSRSSLFIPFANKISELLRLIHGILSQWWAGATQWRTKVSVHHSISRNTNQQITTCRIRNSGSTACNNWAMTASELHRNWPDPPGLYYLTANNYSPPPMVAERTCTARSGAATAADCPITWDGTACSVEQSSPWEAENHFLSA
jgi:hypothetical protein